MIFKKVRFKNFLSFGNTFTEFKLDTNETILITGTNGQGKSALLESIYFGFTGKSYRNVPKGKLVNNKNKKHLLVELTIEHQKNKYLIRRGIRPNVFEIIRNGVLIDEDSNIRDYQKQLETILGMDYKTFKQTIMMSARHYVPFLELNKNQKREFIENIFSLKLFSDMTDFLKRKVQNTKQNIKGLEKDISHTMQSLQVLKDINAKQVNIHKFQKKGILKQIKILEDENKLFGNNIKENVVLIQDKETRIEILKLKIKYKIEITKRIELLKYKIEQHIKKINFFEHHDICENCGTHLEEIFKEEQIKVEQNNIKQKQDKQNKFNDSISKIIEFEEEQRKIITSVNKIRQEIMVLKSKQDGNNFNINEKQESINIIDSTSLINKDDFIDLNNDLIKLRKDNSHLITFLKYIKMTVEMISEKGIKKFIISKYVPILNKLLNKYLKIFEAPYSVMFDEELEENVIARGYEDLGYANLSAGEKQRLDASLVFSFLELCRLKNSVNTNLMILDEILDQSLDQTGINGILQIFEELKVQGYTILVVSHREFFDDAFDKVFTARKKKFSSLEQEN